MSGQIKVGGSWKEIDSLSANISSAWKDVDSGYLKIGAAWEQFYTATPPLEVDYLVLAGGGGGGANNCSTGGGGGAGGYRTSVGTSGGNSVSEALLSLTPSTSYTVTVGAGGARGLASYNFGANGSNSVFATITSSGGGGGAGGPNCASYAGLSGGSGGGGHAAGGGAGTTGQGTDGSTGGGDGTSTAWGGGGGGSSAVGTGGYKIGTSTSQGGTGGNGIASSITGTSVTRGGGGGGGAGPYGSGGPGGSGGGGTGGMNANGFSGTVNLGGGGGGGGIGGNRVGGNGGSGTVIIRYPEAYVATISAGLLSTTYQSGGYNVTEFFAGTGTVSFAVAGAGIPVSYMAVSGGQSGSGFRPGVGWGQGGDGGEVKSGILIATASTSYICQVGAGGPATTANYALKNSGGISAFDAVSAVSRTNTVYAYEGGYGANGIQPITQDDRYVNNNYGGLGVTWNNEKVAGGGSSGNADPQPAAGVVTGIAYGGGAGSQGGGIYATPTANTGGGGCGAINNGYASQAGASGVVWLKYPSSYSITIGAGLAGTTSTSGSYKITKITGGTGTVSFS